MKHKIHYATICLHISAVLYLLLGSLMIPLFGLLVFEEMGALGWIFGAFSFLFCLALVVGIEIVVYGLGRRKYWAWIAGLCIFATYAPSLFLPLGVLGLWGLLDKGSMAEFGITTQKASS